MYTSKMVSLAMLGNIAHTCSRCGFGSGCIGKFGNIGCTGTLCTPETVLLQCVRTLFLPLQFNFENMERG